MIKIIAKPQDTEISVVIDPYKNNEISVPNSFQSEITLLSSGTKNMISGGQNTFICENAGEYEIKGILISGITGAEAQNIHFRIDAEYIRIAYIAPNSTFVHDTQFEELGNIDILLLPVQQNRGLSAEAAVSVMHAIEPRIVIPFDYADKNDPVLQTFIKETGLQITEEKKLTIKKKNLPQEETRLVLLSE